MHEHVGLGQRVGERVMVGHDQLQPQFSGPAGLGHAGDPAVDRDDEVRSLPGQRRQGVGVEAVSLLEAVGDVPRGLGVDRFEAAHQDRRGAHAVGVVVAIDDDLPAGPGCHQDAVGGRGDAGERLGIAQVGERAGEKGLGGRSVADAAGREQAGHDAGNAGGTLQRRHRRAVVGTNMPAFRHGGSCRSRPGGDGATVAVYRLPARGRGR